MQLSIVYLNDVHGYIEPHAELFYEGSKEVVKQAGGYAAIASKIKEIRQSHKNVLLFDGGDTFHGTLPLVKSKGEALIPVLNQLNFSAMVGHWDFAYGPEQLKKLAAALNYPVLGINVYNNDGSLFLPPYIMIQVAEVKIAVIGICSNIIDKTMPPAFSNGLKITNGMEELPLRVKQVKEEGANLIILLSHNGFPQDVEMLTKIDGVDVCLSAHTHNRLYEAVKVNNTIVIQCGCHGSFIGHLELSVEKNKVQAFEYGLITINSSITPDVEIAKMVATIMKPFNELKSTLLGNTSAVLDRYNTLESGMDNFLLAAIKSITNTEIAFSNGWRYGAPIDTGKITRWDLFNIIPMNPPVSTVDLTGEEILKMLEANLEKTFSGDPMKQMGGYVKRCLGLHVKMRIENPKGHRIQQIFINDEPLEKTRIYKVSFVTSQGVPEKLGRNRKDLSIKAVDAMAIYLTDNDSINEDFKNTFSLV